MNSTVAWMAVGDGPAGGFFDDQIAARLLHGRIVVLGDQVDDRQRQSGLRAVDAARRGGP